MDADYNVDLGPDAPALELPWSDPGGRVQYINLRRHPERLAELPEPAEYAALHDLLRAVNAPQSPWQSAKCDVWSESAGCCVNFYEAAWGHGCYVDLVLAEATPRRDDLAAHEAFAYRLAQTLEENDEIKASVEITIRRCYFHRDEDMNAESDAGYCLSIQVVGWGDYRREAAAEWARAVEWLARCLPAVTEDSPAPGAELG